MVRVKATGEITEVGRKVMKLLRAEEKKIRRGYAPPSDDDNGNTNSGTILSLDDVIDGTQESVWLEDHTNVENDVMTEMMEREFREMLTESQRSIYEECILKSMSYVEYGKVYGVCYQYVQKSVLRIRKKAKKFFSR